jgi:hypothetical protein
MCQCLLASFYWVSKLYSPIYLKFLFIRFNNNFLPLVPSILDPLKGFFPM